MLILTHVQNLNHLVSFFFVFVFVFCFANCLSTNQIGYKKSNSAYFILCSHNCSQYYNHNQVHYLTLVSFLYINSVAFVCLFLYEYKNNTLKALNEDSKDNEKKDLKDPKDKVTNLQISSKHECACVYKTKKSLIFLSFFFS